MGTTLHIVGVGRCGGGSQWGGVGRVGVFVMVMVARSSARPRLAGGGAGGE